MYWIYLVKDEPDNDENLYDPNILYTEDFQIVDDDENKE